MPMKYWDEIYRIISTETSLESVSLQFPVRSEFLGLRRSRL